MVRIFLVAVAMAVLLVACGGDDSPIKAGSTSIGGTPTATATPTTPPATPTATPEPKPAPSVDVVYFFADPGSRLLRFAAAIQNPASKAIHGLRLKWDALDAGGALVGSFSSVVSDVAASSTYYYVGGAGGALLSAVPSSVKLTVVDGGSFTADPPANFKTEEITLAPEQFEANQYKVTAAITTGSAPVAKSKLVLQIVLKDATGKVVGANFDYPSNTPDTIEPGTKIRIESRFIRAQGKPTTAEITAYAAQ